MTCGGPFHWKWKQLVKGIEIIIGDGHLCGIGSGLSEEIGRIYSRQDIRVDIDYFQFAKVDYLSSFVLPQATTCWMPVIDTGIGY